jgi:hypothetical protein
MTTLASNAPVNRTYTPVNYCIYCGDTNPPLTDEHIVPFALGGKLVLPKASCLKCQEVTKGITQTVARSMYGNLRMRLDAPTRRPKGRPAKLPLKLRDRFGSDREIKIPVKLWPRSYPVLLLPEPSILSGEEVKTWQVQIRDHQEDIDALYASKFVRFDEKILMSPLIDAKTFCRQLAQIAHAHVVALIGSEHYQDFLIPIILDQSLDAKNLFVFIGGVSVDKEIQSALCLDVIERKGNSFVSCRFSMPHLGWHFPTYQIVCGIIPDETSYQKILSITALADVDAASSLSDTRR